MADDQTEANSPPPDPPSLADTLAGRIADALDPTRDRNDLSVIDQAIADRLNSKHVEKMLDIYAKREEYRHREAETRQRFRPRMFLLVAGAVLVFVMLFGWLAFAYGKAEVILPVITGLSGLIAGALGGYGYARADSPKPTGKSPPTL